MADFARLLKKTIETHGIATRQLRHRVYERARDTVEKKLCESNISIEQADMQRQIMEHAIIEVEAYYQNNTKKQRKIDISNILEKEIVFDSSLKYFSQLQQKEEKKTTLSSCIKDLEELHYPGNVCFHRQKVESGKKLFTKLYIYLGRIIHDLLKIILQSKNKEKAIKYIFEDKKSVNQDLPQQISSSQFLDHNRKNYLQKMKTSSGRLLQKILPSSLYNIFYLDDNLISDAVIINDNMIAKEENWNQKIHLLFRAKCFLSKKLLIIAIILSVFFACILLFGIDIKENVDHPFHIVKEQDTALNNFSESSISKITNRLLPDGKDTNTIREVTEEKKGKNNITHSLSVLPTETASFFEEKTAALPATTEIGTVVWSSFLEKVHNNEDQMVICGDVSIPGKDIRLRMIIHRNMDPAIPASYLIELNFFLPKNFYGGNIEKIIRLAFKASEHSIGQDLYGIFPVHLDDNFFVLAMNATEQQINRNLDIMKQLPWLKLTIAYTNGRIGEFSLAKGKTGDTIFKQILDAEDNKMLETGQAIQEIIQKEEEIE